MRRPFVHVVTLAAILLAGCTSTDLPAIGEGSDGPQAVPGPGREAPGDQGCLPADAAAPDVEAAVREQVRAEVTLTSAVLVTQEDRRAVGAATVTDDGALGPVAVWIVEAGLLLPLNTAAADLLAAAPDASRVVAPRDDMPDDDRDAELLALTLDCALARAGDELPPPPRDEPEVRDELVVATPASVAPGGVVELTFPQETFRGLAWQLDRRTADGAWVTEWWLTSDANSGRTSTVPAGTEGYGVNDVGVGGPGPDRVAVHPDTEPGEYRLCTANAGDDFCTLLTVEAG